MLTEQEPDCGCGERRLREAQAAACDSAFPVMQATFERRDAALAAAQENFEFREHRREKPDNRLLAREFVRRIVARAIPLAR
jgi:hypothetical protein